MKILEKSHIMHRILYLKIQSVLKSDLISENSIERTGQGYMLYLGAWSGCKPTTNVLSNEALEEPQPAGGLTFEPHVGVQTRDVKCQDAYETVVEMGLGKHSQNPRNHSNEQTNDSQ